MAKPERYVDRRAEVRKHLREIEDLVLVADEQNDLVVRGHLQRLAVIRLSGFVEKTVEHVLNGYLEEHSSHRVLRFGKRQVSRLPNMNPSKLETWIGAFDDDWRLEFIDYLKVDERRQTLGNLVGARHKLAHGGAYGGLNGATLSGYHEVAEGVAEFLMERFLPLR
ncbi:HEPN domain-containing protein [Agrococcus jejuensis]|uniref:RiboL-PSP-HEPN domain-containing protein n=1 Tax=Agrococcus jejuensis TaxID=399736 RepID=A0A1G8D4A4_9MICO|nr:HEPN domain-containing protein [Agrococcus jejuensis]SDH52020.1 hypothetical protein SAMN04489720_1497 [Agrococcus jejuensis]